jgi:flagellin-specific chaperone FliS
MKDILVNQYDEVEVNLTQLYDYIKSEMASAGKSDDDYNKLLEQRHVVKDLLYIVRHTLRDLAPELYPEF